MEIDSTLVDDLEKRDKDELRERKKRIAVSTGELSRSSSPNVNASLPVSIRKQIALIKQMEQPSPGGSIEGDGTPTTTGMTPAQRKRIARVHKKNDVGETPLHVAARKGLSDNCMELIKEGADVNCADYAGWTPLHEACVNNHFDTARILLENRADVNLASIDGETPLHDAAARKNAKIVWLLLIYGADRNMRNKDNNRPVDVITEDCTALQLLNSSAPPEECPSSEFSTRSSTPVLPAPAPVLFAQGPSLDTPSLAAPDADRDVINQLFTNTLAQNSPLISSFNVPLVVDIPPNDMETMDNPSSASMGSTADGNFPEEPSSTEHNGGPLLDFGLQQSARDDNATPEMHEVIPQEESPSPREALLSPTEVDELSKESTDSPNKEGSMELGVDEIAPNDEDVPEETIQQRPLRTAVWKDDRFKDTRATVSPKTAYDFMDEEDSRDDVRSESDYGKRRPGRGRGGRRPASGAATPVGASDKRKPGRGRGGRRGSRGISRNNDAFSRSPTNSVSDVPDPYKFGSTTSESEDNDSNMDRETSVAPASKRSRLVEQETTNSNYNSDAEGDDGDSMKTRKVPPLRLSLKNANEDNIDDSLLASANRHQKFGRGGIRGGSKKGAAVDDAQRMTRSKVRQGNKVLDDLDNYTKKKRGKPTLAAESANSGAPSPAPTDLNEPEEQSLMPMTEAEKVLLTPSTSLWNMRKMFAKRWTSIHEADRSKEDDDVPSRYKDFLLVTGDYELANDQSIVKEEKISVPLCVAPELQDLWEEQEKQRRALNSYLEVERVRLKLNAEQEFIRWERHKLKSAPVMSAIRWIVESDTCNPLILDEPIDDTTTTNTTTIVDEDDRQRFTSKFYNNSSQLIQRHKDEVHGLHQYQLSKWRTECQRLGMPVTDKVVDECVPCIAIDEFYLSFP